MPEQSAQTITPPTPGSDAETDARVEDLKIRGLAYAAGALLALFLVAIPLPFPPSKSLAQTVIQLIGGSGNEHVVVERRPEDGFLVYVHVSLLLAAVLSHPILLRHGLDLTAPAGLPDRPRRLRLVLFAGMLTFLIGFAAAATYVPPLLLGYTWSANPIDIQLMWQVSEIIEVMIPFVITSGFAFEVPALVVGIVWLRITTREQLVAWRRFVVLAAFVVGAWVTPTPDPLNQTIVAIPICLLYELGLLLARRVPAESAQPTV